MTPQPVKKMGQFQLNANTVLLTIVLGISGWVLVTVIDLRDRVTGIKDTNDKNSQAIDGINSVIKDHTFMLSDHSTRLTKIEQYQIDHQKK